MNGPARAALSLLSGGLAAAAVLAFRPEALDRPRYSAALVARPAGDRVVLVHIADLPPRERAPLMDRFVAEMAVLRPDGVLVGGDLVYDETREAYAWMADHFRRLEALGIRVVVAPGNHERKGWPEYLRTFGPNAPARADFGRVRVLVLDSAHGRDQFSPSQFRWFRSELQGLGGRTPVVLVHHPLFRAASGIRGEAGGSGGIVHGLRRDFIGLCEEAGVPIVLSGHWHCDGVFDAAGRLRTDGPGFPGTKFVITTALGNELRQVVPGSDLFHGYRVLVFEHGRLVSYTEDGNGDGRPDPVRSRRLGQVP